MDGRAEGIGVGMDKIWIAGFRIGFYDTNNQRGCVGSNRGVKVKENICFVFDD